MLTTLDNVFFFLLVRAYCTFPFAERLINELARTGSEGCEPVAIRYIINYSIGRDRTGTKESV